jgi:hypothetical protein
MKTFFSKNTAVLVGILIMLLASALFTLPAFQGKKLMQHDAVMAQAAAKEAVDYKAEHGEYPHWNNSMFAGMPNYMIAQDFNNNWSVALGRVVMNVFPEPTNVIFIQMLSMFLLLLAMGCSSWLAVVGGIMYGFGCYTLIFIEAGHMSKIISTAFAPLLLAGIVYIFKKRYWTGAAILAVGMGLELYGHHLQITYFLGICLVIYVLWEGVSLVKNAEWAHLSTSLVLMAMAAGLGVLSHSGNLLSASEYSKESTRGATELTISADSTAKDAPVQNGLSKEYAFAWSHGVAESFTLLIPNFVGGSSQGGLDTNSETYKAMQNMGVDPSMAESFVKQSVPMYWGPQSYTAGPGYAGAIVLFLFILSLFIVKGDLRWYLLVMCTLLLSISWGRFFPSFNYWMFDHFPLFNKFRDNKMVMILMQMFLGMGAILALKEWTIAENPIVKYKTGLLVSLGLTAGVCLLFALFGGSLLGLDGGNDAALANMVGGDKGLADTLLTAIKKDRIGLLKADAWRSIGFILGAFGVLWLVSKKTIKAELAIALIGLLVFADLFSFNKRYFNSDDFYMKSALTENFEPTAVDQQIMADKDPHFRMADLTTSFWSDAKPSYYHKSVGGYHGAKLKRIQEVFDHQIAKNNMEVLNMLNTKYIVNNDGQQNVARLNPMAYGNAWFAKKIKVVPDANSEMKALSASNLKDTVIVDQRFAKDIEGITDNTLAQNQILLSNYSPDKLVYSSTTARTALAVFSEVYYRGNQDWKSYIDGQEVPHIRANYLLRALKVPPGKHQIVFEYKPKVLQKTNTLDLIGSIGTLLLVGMAIFFGIKKDNNLQ